MNDQSQSPWKPAWPGRPATLFRLVLLMALLFPLTWAVTALLIGSWRVTIGDPLSKRHFIEWMAAWIALSAVVLWITLLPKFQGLFSRRNARRFFFALACLATVAALFYAFENWRGWRVWKQYREQLEAAGARLDYAAFIPPAIPDEENFAANPVVKSWYVEVNKTVFTNTNERFAKNWGDNYARAWNRMPSPKDKSRRNCTDLAMWAEAFNAIRSGSTDTSELGHGPTDPRSRAAAAPVILEALKTNDAVLAELRDASRRPWVRYPVTYDLDNPWGIFIPHLINIRDACRRLQLRASAELAAGRTDEALADVKLMLYLADTLKSEPFLISYLVRAACLNIAVQPVWEGLAAHTWSDAQLQELEGRLQQYDFVGDLKRPMDGERAAGVLTAELVRKKGFGMLLTVLSAGSESPMNTKFANWCGGLVPRGWYYQEAANYLRLYDMQLDGAFDPVRKTVSPGRITTNRRAFEQVIAGDGGNVNLKAFLRHRVIASALLPALGNISVKAAAAQTVADQAALACALERHRLALGQFPESLDALAPRFISRLPHDPITGKPCQYRRTPDGQFVLYSVGWDEKNDGGTPGKTLFAEDGGDWVWSYPERQL